MKALILVDIQNDFTPTGTLPVPEGDQVVPVVNKLMDNFELVVATQDWHPPDHKSFAVHHNKNPGEIIMLNGIAQILWPVHCVQGSTGAEFVTGLNTKRIAKVFRKGMDREVDSYSGFFDNDHKSDTGLGDYLKERRVDRGIHYRPGLGCLREIHRPGCQCIGIQNQSGARCHTGGKSQCRRRRQSNCGYAGSRHRDSDEQGSLIAYYRAYRGVNPVPLS